MKHNRETPIKIDQSLTLARSRNVGPQIFLTLRFRNSGMAMLPCFQTQSTS